MSGGTTRLGLGNYLRGVPRERDGPTVTGKDGRFEFPSVREGDWLFRVESDDLLHGAAAIAVRQDIDDLQIRLDIPFDLNGSVTLSDGSPVPDQLGVRLDSLDQMPGVSDQSNKNGMLHFKNLTPGRYRIQATALAEKYYVASLMVGTIDAMSQPVSLGSASPPIRIILKPGATITGSVEKGEGATVLLVPQTLAPGDTGWLHACGAGGSFQFAGLAPGDYYAIAVNNLGLQDLLPLSDIGHLRTIVRDATTVRVEEGAVASVQLKAPVNFQ
jgi:hypothetical protein